MPIPQLSWKGKSPKRWKDVPAYSRGHRRFSVRSLQQEKGGSRRRALPSIPLTGWQYLRRWWKRRFGKGSRPRTQQVIFFVGVSFIIFFVTGIAVFAWYAKDLPDPDQLLDRQLAESTRIFDQSGEHTLYEIHGDQRRTVVPLKDIPEHLRQATIAIEDQNFYNHSGFSITGFLRAAWINVTSGGKRRPGGSTITQQFVKNSILTTEKTFTRKIKELVLAYELERKFSKDQILQLYLNEIPYGSNNYGVQAAAESYFGKRVQDLTIAESAILAALPQAPTFYSPYGNNADALIGRQQHILGLMEELEFITTEEKEAALEEKIVFQPKRESITAPHFVFYVREQLVELFGESLVETGGLSVTTTLDFDKQAVAQDAVTNGVDAIRERYNAGNGALVSMDTKTGAIVAMVGSRDYFDIENDGNVNVAIRSRQPGSSFKPMAYAAAFRGGYTPETMLFDLVTSFSSGASTYTPQNYDGGERGPISMRQALAGSLNIPAVKTLYLAGVNNVLTLAKDLGYTTLGDPDRYGLSLVLGGGEVTLLEHVSAYSALAREGVRHPAYAIERVEDKNGKILFEHKVSEERVLEESVGRQINDILSDDGARAYVFGRGSRLTLPDRPVAAKTGTTNDYRDGWTMGYTPSLATGVWVGNNDNTEMAQGAAGSVTAAPIWNEYMRSVLTGTPVETFKPPTPENVEKPVLRGEIDEVTIVPVDRLTGRRIPSSCRDTYPKDFIEERSFKETHTILHYVERSNPRGNIPNNPEQDPQYSRWEGPVVQWAAGQPGYGDPSQLEEESCDLRGEVGELTASFTKPKKQETVTTEDIAITLQIRSTTTIEQAVLSLDGKKFATLTKNPWSTTLDMGTRAAGFYELSAVITDSLERTVTVKRVFNYLPSASESVYFINPSDPTTVQSSSFPIPLTIFAYDPDDIARIDWFFHLEGTPSSGALQFATTNEPTTDTIQESWDTAPAPGTYLLFATMVDPGAGRTTSDTLEITVE